MTAKKKKKEKKSELGAISWSIVCKTHAFMFLYVGFFQLEALMGEY